MYPKYIDIYKREYKRGMEDLANENSAIGKVQLLRRYPKETNP